MFRMRRRGRSKGSSHYRTRNFRSGFHHWKQAHAKLRQLTDITGVHPLVNLNALQLADLEVPGNSGPGWIISVCSTVPFSYLVPDERMLTLKSIRFFWIDWIWTSACWMERLALARQTNADATRDAEHKTKKRITNAHALVTGVMLRSQVVSGRPGLQVDDIRTTSC